MQSCLSGMRVKNVTHQCAKPVFLKLCSTEPQDSSKVCQGFRKTKMRNGVRVLLAVLKLCVPTEIRAATLHNNHSVTDRTQSIAASIQKLPDSVVKSVSEVRHTQNLCARGKDQIIDQFGVSR